MQNAPAPGGGDENDFLNRQDLRVLFLSPSSEHTRDRGPELADLCPSIMDDLWTLVSHSTRPGQQEGVAAQDVPNLPLTLHGNNRKGGIFLFFY